MKEMLGNVSIRRAGRSRHKRRKGWAPLFAHFNLGCSSAPMYQEAECQLPSSCLWEPGLSLPEAGSGAPAHAQPGLSCTKESPWLSLEPLSIAVVPGPAGSIRAFSWGLARGRQAVLELLALGSLPARRFPSRVSRAAGKELAVKLPLRLSALPSQEEGEAERQAQKHAQMHTNAPDLHFVSHSLSFSPILHTLFCSALLARLHTTALSFSARESNLTNLEQQNSATA